MHTPRPAQSPIAQSLAPRVPGLVTRAMVGGRVEQIPDGRTLKALYRDGTATELDYLTEPERTAASELEFELMVDAAADVDLRARLVAHACSR